MEQVNQPGHNNQVLEQLILVVEEVLVMVDLLNAEQQVEKVL
jgi:hypothetical protein